MLNRNVTQIKGNVLNIRSVHWQLTLFFMDNIPVVEADMSKRVRRLQGIQPMKMLVITKD